MRFQRSCPEPDSPNLIEGCEVLVCEATAIGSPHRLEDRIIHSGHGVIGSWIFHEEAGAHDAEIAQKFGLSESVYKTTRDHPDEPFLFLTSDHLLFYCKSIGVHPAHLVPFDDDPRLSLPAVVLEANLDILSDPMSSPAEHMLAEQAVISEMERYVRMMKQSLGAKFSAEDKLLQRVIVRGYSAKGCRAIDKAFRAAVDSRFPFVQNVASLVMECAVIREDMRFDKLSLRCADRELKENEAFEEMVEAYASLFGDHGHSSEYVELFVERLAELVGGEPAHNGSAPLSKIRKVIEGEARSLLPHPNDVPSHPFERSVWRDERVKFDLDNFAQSVRQYWKETSKHKEALFDFESEEDLYGDRIAHIYESIGKIGLQKYAHVRRLFANKYRIERENFGNNYLPLSSSSPIFEASPK